MSISSARSLKLALFTLPISLCGSYKTVIHFQKASQAEASSPLILKWFNSLSLILPKFVFWNWKWKCSLNKNKKLYWRNLWLTSFVTNLFSSQTQFHLYDNVEQRFSTFFGSRNLCNLFWLLQIIIWRNLNTYYNILDTAFSENPHVPRNPGWKTLM